ncbi:hypothetical protein [Actinoplanes sp. NPDC026670]|uniref:hypothetical protein n=1 Tax=Actinoplanes sp. NPDC026670 TaxID=3154700 RepID=UPI0033C3785E
MSEHNTDPARRAEDAADTAATSADNARAAAAKATAAAEETGKNQAVLVPAALGAVTSLLALFLGVGLTADRMPTILNGGTARELIITALILAAAALGLGLTTATLPARFRHARATTTALAPLTLVGSLTCGILAASSAFTDGGRPNISKISLVAEGDHHAVLSFTVTATGVRHDNLLRAFAIWVPTPPTSASTAPTAPGSGPAPPATTVPFYQATLRPDDNGEILHEVTVLIERQPAAHFLRIQIYWDSTANTPPTDPTPSTSGPQIMTPITPPPPVGAQCGNQAQAAEAAACADILLTAEVPPSPS